jgi:hypothetical protein
LGQDDAGGVVHHGEQMHLAAVVASGAAEGLAVDCDRTPPLAGIVTVDQPRADDGGYRVRLQTGEGPPDRGFGRHPSVPGEGILPGAKGGTDGLVGVGGPLSDRGE